MDPNCAYCIKQRQIQVDKLFQTLMTGRKKEDVEYDKLRDERRQARAQARMERRAARVRQHSNTNDVEMA